jgi:putative transposase
MIWARMLAYSTGTVDQELLLRNEYLAAENRILKAQITGRLLLSEADKATLAEIAYRLGPKALKEVAGAAKPDTILGWYRKLIANKFDGSRFSRSAGRPRVEEETERLVVQMAKENSTWGYDRIVGALANLGQPLSDQTVGNILRRHGVPPAPKRKHTTSWKDFTGMFWWERISSRWKCLRSKDWLPTMCCSLFSWRVAGFAWPESLPIRTRSGWNRWGVT